MNKALIGHTGFVGTTLKAQTKFSSQYRSTDIDEIRGKSFDTVVCAGAPAQKWIANQKPDQDLANIEALISHLDQVDCDNFILISTVDVFHNPVGVNEDSTIDEDQLHAYGKNRRLLEKFVQQRFSKNLIARLPGLVGPGLRKNVVYDFLNNHDLEKIDSRGIYQFYPMVNLWHDLQTATDVALNLVHLTAEPVSVADLHQLGFGSEFSNHLQSTPASYDMQTRYSSLFGGRGLHQYSIRDTVQAVRAYAQSEPRTLTVQAK